MRVNGRIPVQRSSFQAAPSHSQFELKSKFQVSLQWRMLQQPPPRWLRNWRRMLLNVLQLELAALCWMSRMVCLGMASRSWITLKDKEEESLWEEQMINLKKNPIADAPTCRNPRWKRYGNRRGSFATCILCRQKTKWDPDQEKWVVTGGASSRKSSLPAPSSSDILQATPICAASKSRARPPNSSAAPSSSAMVTASDCMGMLRRDIHGPGRGGASSSSVSIGSRGELAAYEAQQQEIINQGRAATQHLNQQRRQWEQMDEDP